MTTSKHLLDWTETIVETYFLIGKAKPEDSELLKSIEGVLDQHYEATSMKLRVSGSLNQLVESFEVTSARIKNEGKDALVTKETITL